MMQLTGQNRFTRSLSGGYKMMNGSVHKLFFKNWRSHQIVLKLSVKYIRCISVSMKKNCSHLLPARITCTFKPKKVGASLITGMEYGTERWNGKWNGTVNIYSCS